MKILSILMTIIIISMMISAAVALPEMLDSFNTKYNTKGTRLDTCDLCHMRGKPQRSTCNEVCHIPNKPKKIDPINLNPYGMDLKVHLDTPVDQALTVIENLDSDGDKFTNIDEIHNLTFPGEKSPQKENKKNSLSLLSELLNFLTR